MSSGLRGNAGGNLTPAGARKPSVFGVSFAPRRPHAAGRLVANVFASVARWEAENISLRTKEGPTSARAKGGPVSGPSVADSPELRACVSCGTRTWVTRRLNPEVSPSTNARPGVPRRSRYAPRPSMPPVIPPKLVETVVRHAPQPKNILGFLFAMVSLVFVMLVVVSVALIKTEYAWLVMPLMGIAVIFAAVTMFGVFRRAATNPAGLMLGSVSGPEYESIQRTLVLGDSSRGTREEPITYDAQPIDVVNSEAETIVGGSLQANNAEVNAGG